MSKAKSAEGLTIGSLLRPYRGILALGAVAVITDSIVGLLEPWPLKIVIDNILKTRSNNSGWLNQLILHHLGTDKISILKSAAIAYIAIACAGAISSYAEKYITTSVGQWVTHDLRLAIYAHIQRLSLAYHDDNPIGDLLSRVTSDIDSVQSFIVSGLMSVFVNSVLLIGMIGVMTYLNWRFTLITLSVSPLLALIVYTYTRRIKKASRQVRKKEGEIVSVMQEVLSSIRVVKAFAREDHEQHRLEEQSLEGIEMALQARSLKAKLSPLVEVIVAMGTAMVLWFGARMALEGTLSPGALIVFLFYVGKLYKPMQELSKMTDSYSKASVGFERIREVLETRGSIKDVRSAKRLTRVKGEIQFDHVNFAYKESEPILKDVSFSIKPGQMVALVGPSGAGKTTVISLIPRFYDPTSGVIRVDGYDIKQLQQKSLRRQIGFVLQDTTLFHAAVWSNIAYGRPSATREEILRAAKLANADEFIRKLPDGYDTLLGERGLKLSGGQRQRIAIARALICDTPILILDEPSSGLDAESEKLVFEALERLTEGKTTVVIAHRLSTIKRADCIFVVFDGQITETGRHDELIASGGIYSGLYELQFQQSGT